MDLPEREMNLYLEYVHEVSKFQAYLLLFLEYSVIGRSLNNGTNPELTNIMEKLYKKLENMTKFYKDSNNLFKKYEKKFKETIKEYEK